MEGVGARLGRSSTRYGPPTVFNGPVRKWKKKWVHVSPSGTANNHSQTNGTNGNNGSHIVLYKWTPISQSNNATNSNNNGDKTPAKEDDAAASADAEPEEPPRRRFKYISIAVLEEQNTEAAEKVEDEAKPADSDPTSAEPTSAEPASKSNDIDEKPDINDVPMEENQDLSDDDKKDGDSQAERQDLNESTLDLSLGLKGHDEGDRDSDSKTDQTKDQLESSGGT